MKENTDYEITFLNGSVTTLRLLETRESSTGCDDCLLEYLEGETRKPITPDKGNTFWFPKPYLKDLERKKI